MNELCVKGQAAWFGLVWLPVVCEKQFFDLSHLPLGRDCLKQFPTPRDEGLGLSQGLPKGGGNRWN